VLTTRPPFAYQIIAEKSLQLHRLGMSACAIARVLGLTDKTVARALRYARTGPPTGAQ
jgi:transposase